MAAWQIYILIGVAVGTIAFVLGFAFGYTGFKGNLEMDGYFVLIDYSRQPGNGRYSIHTLTKLEAKNGPSHGRDKIA